MSHDYPETDKARVSQKLISFMKELQKNPGDWIYLGSLENHLSDKLPAFSQAKGADLLGLLASYGIHLESKKVQEPGLPEFCFVRLPDSSSSSEEKKTSPKGKLPSPSDRLTEWSFINFNKFEDLAKLALPEKWYYGENPPKNEPVPLLKNYLNYTFKRLVWENKVLMTPDSVPPQETYATFNTGLVDQKYDDIYALFKQNTHFPTPFWYLLDFVVAGEDTGKTLVRVFNPLPERADYFENKVENMLYDSATGDLSCDYTHIIVERTQRLPLEFLEDNLSPDMMEIDGLPLREAYNLPNPYAKKSFFHKLGEKIEANQRVFNRLKNRFQDAVELALKRVQWNYKTAIPMYNPRTNQGSLLLPLCLLDENKVDLALVVVRHPSGSYQGETVLPLYLAYSNSRLVSRPDSDWLNTDRISTLSYDSEEDDED